MPLDPRPDRAQLLDLARSRKRRRRVYGVLAAGVVALAVAGGLWWRATRPEEGGFRYITLPSKLGDLSETVTATGTLKGLHSVDVGAQISGRISKVLVDFNDTVKAGQVLAEIDQEQLKSRVEQSRAQVNAADAAVKLARATAQQAKAQFERARELNQKGLLSNRELEAALADADRAEASVASAQAQSTLARAQSKDAATSLSWATIRAPIDGVVLARLVEPGQTVAASLQSPVLFTLARDLNELLLYVDIDEADVGRVREGQATNFSVDAWPNKTFESKVVSVRNMPTAGQTVVTYQALLSANNQERLLRPGMTATATIVTNERKGVALVPNSALRFTPPMIQDRSGGGLPFMGMPRFGGSRDNGAELLGEAEGAVYVLRNEKPERQVVKIGGSDGEWTEVLGGTLEPGTALVIDAEARKAD